MAEVPRDEVSEPEEVPCVEGLINVKEDPQSRNLRWARIFDAESYNVNRISRRIGDQECDYRNRKENRYCEEDPPNDICN